MLGNLRVRSGACGTLGEMTEAERKALLAQREAVQRIALRLVYDAREVEDVVQETWVAGWQRDSAPGSGWLARTVRNLARTRNRARQRRRRREEAAARKEAQPSTDEVVAKAEMQREVVDAVLALPEPYRTTILLRYFENLPPRRIAQRMEAPVDTVKTRLERGHRILRKSLDRKHGSRRTWMGAFVPLLASRALAGTGVALMAKKTLGIAAALLVLAASVHFATRAREGSTPPNRAQREVETPPATKQQSPRAAAISGRTLSGRVVDGSGEAVAGARVQVLGAKGASRRLYGPPTLNRLRADWDRARTLLPQETEARTDAEGRFDVTAPPDCRLLVRAKEMPEPDRPEASATWDLCGCEKKTRQWACHISFSGLPSQAPAHRKARRSKPESDLRQCPYSPWPASCFLWVP